MELIKTINETYTIGANTNVESNCIAIAFFNKDSSNPCLINGVEINANETYRVEQSQGYIDTTRYDVLFSGGEGTNELVVSRVLIR